MLANSLIQVFSMKVNGFWVAEWAPVINAFIANFSDAGVGGSEQGAGVAIYHNGDLVVNAWAGERTNRLAEISGQPWDDNTLVNIFSAGKGLVAVCVLQLVAQGKIELDAPVAQYWPEFAAGDKSEITVRQILSHRSGLSAFHQHSSNDQIFNWSQMKTAIENETPWWKPNTAQGYSPFIFGWILGELVKRVSGENSFNDYFQNNIAKPLRVDCYFGVPDSGLQTLPILRRSNVHLYRNQILMVQIARRSEK